MANALATRSNSALNTQVQLLRAHLQAESSGPAIIMVTSAEAGDGKSVVAHSLAESLARAGLRTAFFDASDASSSEERRALPGAQDEPRPNVPVTLSFPGAQLATPSREAMTEFMASVRSSYDFAIVDTPPLLSSDAAMSLAGLADGIFVAVKLGRKVSDKDAATVRVLEQSKGNVLGIVATESKVIAEFNSRRGEQYVALPGSVDDEPVKRSGSPRLRIAAAALAIGIVGASAFVALSGPHHGRLAGPSGAAKAFVSQITGSLRL